MSTKQIRWANLIEKTAREAWETCPRGDWLLWAAEELDVDRRILVRASVECARTVLPYAGQWADELRACLDVAERWTRSEATDNEMLQARWAAIAAARVARCMLESGELETDYTDAAFAVSAAAADTRDERAAVAVAYAADALARDDSRARNEALARSAEIVRAIIPWSVVEKALAEKLQLMHAAEADNS